MSTSKSGKPKNELRLNAATLKEALEFWLAEKVLKTDRVFSVAEIKSSINGCNMVACDELHVTIEFGAQSVNSMDPVS